MYRFYQLFFNILFGSSTHEMKPDFFIIFKPGISVMPGASLLPNDADANPAPRPSVSTNDNESTITDQVITRIEPLSSPVVPEENGLPDTPPVRALFLVSEEYGGDSNIEYDSDGNTGPSFEQVEGEPDIETYHEDEVVTNAPDTNPVAPEENRNPTDDEIKKCEW